MTKRILGVPESLARVVVVFAFIMGGVLLIRSLLPTTLIDSESHVASTIEREKAKVIRYAGSVVCGDCHEEAKVKRAGYHSMLSCETCHGSAKEHSENPTEIKPVIPRKREFCALCHTYNPSRPTGFPQINPAAHNPLKACASCHNPHDPKPPRVPRECDACHAEIARTKSVSPHVQLECTTCHNTPLEHKVKPRAARASIPTDRNFCGKCHAEGSGSKDAPKVDFSAHGEKYLCWQCHYPHMPELGL